MYESLELAHISGITLFAKKAGERLPFHHVIRFGSTRSLHPAQPQRCTASIFSVHWDCLFIGKFQKIRTRLRLLLHLAAGGCQNVAVLQWRKLQGDGVSEVPEGRGGAWSKPALALNHHFLQNGRVFLITSSINEIYFKFVCK